MEKIRVRFAPSPTGPLHIGGARTALFNWLFARKNKGVMVLRIEDTDLERSTEESERNIIRDLKWLGIDWDEGPEVGGPYAPYRQTERLDLYREYTERLLAEGKAYYCFCSEEEVEEERQRQLARGETPHYSGKCRHLSRAEQEKYLQEGRPAVVRFRVPAGERVVVDDIVRGRVEFDSDGIGDFVLVKSDGLPTYNYACVIDDYLMEITHVIRGEEHLSNTPRQVLLYQAFGWEPPKFAHISLILAEDRTKMSKRKGDTAVEQYREKGYLPEAVVNFLALLGWSPEGEEEVFLPAELIRQFDLSRVSRAPAVFDMNKLRWLNGHYIKNSPLERITELALPYLQKAGYLGEELTLEEREWVKMVVASVREYPTCLAEIVDYVDVFFNDEIEFEREELKEILRQEQVPRVVAALYDALERAPALTPEAAKKMLRDISKELKLGGKKVYMPLRIALTGKGQGPELYELIAILGKERVVSRINRTLALAGVDL
ncbi:MAG TPA: glutamate--tRNA ligase [Firmicutes bacterium]|nr:glutamate--tRNA ligase [Bacillota bacterium]